MITLIRLLMTHHETQIGLPIECVTEGHDFSDYVLVGAIDWQDVPLADNCHRCEIPYEMLVSE